MTAESNPIDLARRGARPRLPKRFYQNVTVDSDAGLYSVMLDGRPVMTPGRARLALPDREVAAAVKAEWVAQVEVVDPSTMPATRIANSAIDVVAARADEVRGEVISYAGNDLLCYRVARPDGLVQRQRMLWDPPLDWAAAALGAELATAEGIVPFAQPDAAVSAIAGAVAPFEILSLAALHVATALTGSAVLALSVAHGRLSIADAWQAAHVDEDWQIAQWGEDEETLARRGARWRDMAAAGLILRSWREATIGL